MKESWKEGRGENTSYIIQPWHLCQKENDQKHLKDFSYAQGSRDKLVIGPETMCQKEGEEIVLDLIRHKEEENIPWYIKLNLIPGYASKFFKFW